MEKKKKKNQHESNRKRNIEKGETPFLMFHSFAK